MALVRHQFPHLAHLEPGAMTQGWDTAMIRLGPDLAVRLPRIEDAVGSVLKEQRLLSLLGARWTFPFPAVVERGEPGEGFPWPWSIVTWLPGSIAAHAPLNENGAAKLGAALTQVHTPAPADAPFNDEQSIGLHERAALEHLATVRSTRGPAGEQLDEAAAVALWEGALDSPPGPTRVWSHADLHGFNVLTEDGDFAGIIDWGDLAHCDPAVDLGFVYTLTDRAGLKAAFAAYGADRQVNDPGLLTRAAAVGLDVSLRLAAYPAESTKEGAWRGLVSLGVAR